MKKTGLLLLGLIVVYVLATILISKYLSNSYGESFNSERKRLHLFEISDGWRLDSVVVLEEKGNYSIEERKNISEFQLWLEDERVYCQYWSSVRSEDVHSNFIGKRIYYWESFWVWKNERLFEQDVFEKKSRGNADTELIIGFDFKNDSSYAYQSELMTTEFWDSVDVYAEKNELEICGTGLMGMDRSGFLSMSNALSILEEWRLGRESHIQELVDSVSVYEGFTDYKAYKMSDSIVTDLDGDLEDDLVYFANKGCNKLIFKLSKIGIGEVGCTESKFLEYPVTIDWVDEWGLLHDELTWQVLILDNGDIDKDTIIKLQNPGVYIGEMDGGGGVITIKDGKPMWVHQSD